MVPVLQAGPQVSLGAEVLTSNARTWPVVALWAVQAAASLLCSSLDSNSGPSSGRPGPDCCGAEAGTGPGASPPVGTPEGYPG